MYIILLIFFILLVLIANKLYKRTNAYKNIFIDIQKFKSVEKLPNASLDLVTIGSNSPKYAFDFSNINQLNCYNWCIGPETFQYDSIILRKYSCKLKKGAIVVLTICPLNFFHHHYHPHSDLYKYYALLNKQEMPDFNYIEYLRYYKYPILFNPKKAIRVFYDVRENNMIKLKTNLYNRKTIIANANKWIKNIWNPAYNIDIENMQPLSEINKNDIKGSKFYLREIADFCNKEGFNLLLIYPPITTELKSKFSDEFIQKYIKQYVQEALHGIDYKTIDYMQDNRFHNMKYYIDAFFMNRIGAQYFTQTFISENILNYYKHYD